MNLEQFVKAERFFKTLEDKGFQIGDDSHEVPVPPHNADIYFRTAAYAVALLYSIGVEQLRELEKEGVIHPSTIAGGSLSSAMLSLTNYFIRQEDAFRRDDYEQLKRTCISAKRLLERERG